MARKTFYVIIRQDDREGGVLYLEGVKAAQEWVTTDRMQAARFSTEREARIYLRKIISRKPYQIQKVQL
ncbi:hypothetical protein [Larkinella soli]|uniref:hypothetical protein n=1 Tax=Larkinella soli TaxID=1770527 RepID=UPI000FFC6BF8|nr:hypothetical protein [Larkinella soli]